MRPSSGKGHAETFSPKHPKCARPAGRDLHAGAVVLRLRRRVRSRFGLFLRESARRNRPGAVAAVTLVAAGTLVVVGPVLPDVRRPAVAGVALRLVAARTLGLLLYGLFVRLRRRWRAQD